MSTAIHRYFEPGMGSVNAYWIETSDGVVVVDGQRALSQARNVRAEIERTGKPIAAAFLTHPHPDHFGGLGVLARGVPFYASAQTRASITEDRWGLVKATREVLPDDSPETPTLPDHDLVDGQELRLAGVRIAVHELGEGEAECLTALHLPDEGALLCGDVVQHAMTAYLLEGRLKGWLAQIERTRALFALDTRTYPGHGEPGPLGELLDEQRSYLETFADLVRAGDDKAVVAGMEARYAGYLPVAAIPDLLEKDVPPVRKALRG